VPDDVRPITTGTTTKAGRSFLVAGEPGTGRTTCAYEVAGHEAVIVMDAAEAVSGADRGWAARLVGLVASGAAVVLVEDVHVLSESLCAVVRRVLASASRTRFVLTSCPLAELPVPAARLVARCAQQVELEPLRERRHALPAMIAAMADRARPGRELILTPRLLEVLGAQPWPGNLVELEQLVAELCAIPTTRRIDVGDLPARYRSTARTVGRGGRERAERVAIVHSLQATGGNKLRAAELLGISRTTLYRRMRALDVGEDARG
jgi:transcriptional regulator with AAA-type ATPase domain